MAAGEVWVTADELQDQVMESLQENVAAQNSDESSPAGWEKQIVP